jgi:hypothetical protein
MPCPNSWDPYFTSYMALAGVYRYPTRHLEHHLRQLTLPAAHAGGSKDEPEVVRPIVPTLFRLVLQPHFIGGAASDVVAAAGPGLVSAAPV